MHFTNTDSTMDRNCKILIFLGRFKLHIFLFLWHVFHANAFLTAKSVLVFSVQAPRNLKLSTIFNDCPFFFCEQGLRLSLVNLDIGIPILGTSNLTTSKNCLATNDKHKQCKIILLSTTDWLKYRSIIGKFTLHVLHNLHYKIYKIYTPPFSMLLIIGENLSLFFRIKTNTQIIILD